MKLFLTNKSDAKAKQISIKRPIVSKKPLHLLYLEDNKMDAQLAYDLLAMEDYQLYFKVVETKKTFEEAVKNNTYDLVLADYMLPMFDGLSALQFVQKYSRETPFIMVSGVASEEFAINSIKAGATDFVLKTQLGRLIPSIKRALHESEERKKFIDAEKLLSKANRVISTIFSTTTDAMLIVDRKGQIQLFNKAAQTLFGFDPKKAFLTHVTELISALPLKQDTKPKTYQLLGKLQNEQNIPLQVKVVYLNEEPTDSYLVVAQRVSEEETNQWLIQETQRLAQLGGWSYEPQQHQYRFTEEALNILGIEKEAQTNQLVFFADRLHAHDAPLLKSKIDAMLTNRKPFIAEYRLQKQDKQDRWVRVQASTLGEGQTLQVIGTIQDITQAKNHEDTLKLRNEELDTFVYRVSHDLRSPVCSIKGLIGLMEKESGSPKMHHYTQLAMDTLNKQEKFIAHTANYSKNINTAVIISLTNLEALVWQTIRSFEMHPHYARTKFDVKIEASKFYSDPARVQIILSNLISNALDFQHPDPERQPFLKIHAETPLDANHVDITIEDNGCGVSKDKLPDIFKMFFRGNAKSKGSGVGLYVVKQVIERLDGQIEANSQLGQGTVFKVSLPNRNLSRLKKLLKSSE